MRIEDMMRMCCCEQVASPYDDVAEERIRQMREEVAYLRGVADGMRGCPVAAEAVDAAPLMLPKGSN